MIAVLRSLQGCTAIGHAVGNAIDNRHARIDTLNLLPDSCNIEKGDMVRLTLVSGDSLVGKVKKVEFGQSLTLITRFADPIAYKPAQMQEIGWARIRFVTVMQKPATWRAILTPVGLAIDAVLISLYIRASFAWSGWQY